MTMIGRGGMLPTTFTLFYVLFLQCRSLMLVVHGLAVPESEWINRRKSPALWRNDLQNQDSITSTGTITTATSDPLSQKKIRLVQRPPEVMAPCGGWPQLHAAIGNGADAIYLGLSAFSARARASNFDPVTELPEAVTICHKAGVQVYVALNTLVFDSELEEVEELIRHCATAKVDALIVQDLGVAKMAQRVAPQLAVHASTQQTVTSADGVQFCHEVFKSTRVVLGRELSTTEIEMVAECLDNPPSNINNNIHSSDNNHIMSHEGGGVEIETFVHGALCVSYSGQCFSSEAWGGRSANRGQCAQACRLPYGLIDNGQLLELGDFHYLLSPQDLCGIDHVPQLLEAHVSCLKIEGRLKDAAYVAATTRAYRHAVDQAWSDYCKKHGISNQGILSRAKEQRQKQLGQQASWQENEPVVTRDELMQVFSRGQDEHNNGLTPGFFDGTQHQRLVIGRSPRHRGVHIGRVMEGSNWKRGLMIYPSSDDDARRIQELKLGDGIVVDRGMAQDEELGGAIFEILHEERNHHNNHKRNSGDESNAILRFSRDMEQRWRLHDEHAQKNGHTAWAPAGAHVWKTSDAAIDKKLKRLSESASSSLPNQQHAVRIRLSGQVGEPLLIQIIDSQGNAGTGLSNGTLEKGERSGLDPNNVKKAIGTLGNTNYVINGDLDMSELDEAAWCPVSWIKGARRQALEDLESQTASTSIDSSSKPFEEASHPLQYGVAKKMLEDQRQQSVTSTAINRKIPKISVLARNFEQVDALCELVEQQQEQGQQGYAPMVDEIIVDFLEVDGMREAVARIRKTHQKISAVVASPRIIKPGESGIWRTLLRLEADGLLIRSTGLLYRMMKMGGSGARVKLSTNGSNDNDHTVTIPELIGDFSLNVANALTAWELLQYGCSRVTASYDLSANAITELLDTHAAAQMDVVVHTHMPIFHTEHCVFARFLSNGNSYVDCGHVCTRHNVHLRDSTGADNLVLADMGCRNTVFSAQAQSGAYSLLQWKAAGGQHFRIELVDESPHDAQRIVRGYVDVMNGTMRPKKLWETILKDVRDGNGRAGGVSHGSLRNGVERRAGELA